MTQPHIKFAKGWLETPRGKVCSSWKVVKDEVVYESIFLKEQKESLRFPGRSMIFTPAAILLFHLPGYPNNPLIDIIG